MKVTWYMRVLLFFNPMVTTVTHYTQKGQGLQVTASFKECCGKEYIYEIIEDLYNLKGKHNKRARRHK